MYYVWEIVKRASIVLLFLACMLVMSIVLSLKYYVAKNDFQAVAERFISKVMNTDVTVGKVRVGLFENIALSELNIDAEKKQQTLFHFLKIDFNPIVFFKT